MNDKFTQTLQSSFSDIIIIKHKDFNNFVENECAIHLILKAVLGIWYTVIKGFDRKFSQLRILRIHIVY
jgi:hypothetical protein